MSCTVVGRHKQKWRKGFGGKKLTWGALQSEWRRHEGLDIRHHLVNSLSTIMTKHIASRISKNSAWNEKYTPVRRVHPGFSREMSPSRSIPKSVAKRPKRGRCVCGISISKKISEDNMCLYRENKIWERSCHEYWGSERCNDVEDDFEV